MTIEELKKHSKIKYEGPKSKNELAFKFYNPEEVINGKTMKEHLKFAMSYWHTLCAEGTDPFGQPTSDKKFGGKTALEIYKNKAEFGFLFMDLLDLEYFCFHDVDMAPEGKNLKESFENFDIMVSYIKELQKKYNKKLLWGTANNFTNKMFMTGAATSPNADVFAIAAAKIKKAIDATYELGGTGYVFWGGREGYETLLNTKMDVELNNLATMLKISRDYGRKIGFKGDFYIEPKPKEPTKHQYDFDSATTIGFLRKNDLLKDFRLNIEANHATLAGHTFQHEIATARIEGVFGSIDANEGDLLLGWDTDQFPFNVYDATLCMYEVLKAGGFTDGGLNFDAKTRRPSNTVEDLLLAYIHGMDTYALGLRKAVELIEDERLDNFKENRYQSFNTEFGQKILNNKITLEELTEHALKNQEPDVKSGKQEYLEMIVNQILFRG
ncbi:Xylose isomerase [Alteracholeplasma palmae J233]|uniref:Xylose isomerase n=1 Tax=Alteracholeplasma palmae (strain ATCC 49389 / J233) TaxID=1318466 RepID=U4KKQ7_ALTPJ|nr:xylose isomerase [Alteracholeplasma palmae]CCV64223.1 Xylose isomerase [Alteracholeplasma palmae J233]